MKKRGIALFVTLLVVAIFAVLSSAFLGLNRANLQLFTGSRTALELGALADTAVEYARLRLDSVPGWGLPTGTDRPLESVVATPDLTVYEGEADGVVSVVGVTKAGHFQLHFQAPTAPLQPYQAYAGVSADPGEWTTRAGDPELVSVNYSQVGYAAAPLTPPRCSRRALAPGCVNLQIEARSQQGRRLVDCTLKRAFVMDASAFSGGHLAVGLNGGQWKVSSADRTTNKVRARESIVLPGTGLFSFGDEPNAGQGVATGEVLANGGVLLDSGGNVTSTSGQALSTNLPLKGDVEAASNSTLQPRSSDNPEVPALDDDDLKTAPGAVRSIEPGLYHFTGPEEVSYFANPLADPSSPPTATFTGTIPDRGGAGPAVHIKEHKFIIPGKVEVGGELRLGGVVGDRVTLALGYGADGTLAPDAPPGRLEVAGNVTVRAETVGQGSLVAKAGGVTLEGNSALSANPSQGVAVYAEGPVRLEPVPGWVAGADLNQLDRAVYAKALGVVDSEGRGGHTYGNVDVRKDPNQIQAWTYQGQYLSPQPNVSDPFVLGDDQKVGGTEVRDVVLGTNASDPLVQQLKAVAQSTQVYQTNADFQQQFDRAIDGYLTGYYDNFPFSGETYPIEPGLTLGRYERLREILTKSEADPSSWQDAYYGAVRVDPNNASFGSYHFGESIYNRTRDLAAAAMADGKTLQDYLATYEGETLSPLDVLFRGLIYTHQNLYVNTNNHRFTVEGALVSRQGDMVVANATGVNFRYDPTYFEGLLDTESNSDLSRIQVVFYAVR